MLVYIEGNIGSGKSTFVEKLKAYLPQFVNQKLNAGLLQEPVDEWMKTLDSDGKNILEKFYGNQERWSFTFQMNSFISRAKCIMDEFDNMTDSLAQQDPHIPCLFVERSIYTDRYAFASNCYESGKMTKLEYDIYCKCNDWLSYQFNLRPTAYIYLRCNPNINFERIAKRSREGEENIPLDYLQKIHDKHDIWMNTEKDTNGIPVLTIDVSEDFTSNDIMDEIFNDVYKFVQTL